MATTAFTVCFAAWVINAVLVTSLVSNGTFDFDESQSALLLALPILTGAITRVPLGLLTDRFGGRPVLTILMLLVAAPLGLLSFATTYTHFVLAALGFGLAGGSFAVGVGYVSSWFDKSKQGTALGVFGMGNVGAAATTLFAPKLLETFLAADPLNGWRMLPRVYAAGVTLMALAFFFTTKNRKAEATNKTMADRLAPLKSVRVWRFGLYYFLVFGGFVSLAQWIVPYSVNTYGMSIAEAGLLASAFSLPSGIIRAAGGWLSDRFGARSVMYGVFTSCILICFILAIPKMDVRSPGEGIASKATGVVSVVTNDRIVIGDQEYQLTPPPDHTLAEQDVDSSAVLPAVLKWQEPAVEVGSEVQKKQLIAVGVTNIYYPSNKHIFAFLLVLFGIATGIGTAGVYKFIPDHFPGQVGAVGGMVGLLGAMGGFIFPITFGYLLKVLGFWASCWLALGVVSIICLVWMHIVVQRLINAEAPELRKVVEVRNELAIGNLVPEDSTMTGTIADVLVKLPLFTDLTRLQLGELAQSGEVTSVEAKTMIFDEGDDGDRMFIILAGMVEIFRHSEGGEMVISKLGPGDHFGELALIDGRNRFAAVRTVGHTRIFILRRDTFLKLLTGSPRIASQILIGLSGIIRRLTDQLQPVDATNTQS